MNTPIDWYLNCPDDIKGLLADRLERASAKAPGGKIDLCFRADDIGVPGRGFFRLVDLFMAYDIPLALAVVPAWITAARWEALTRKSQAKPDLWLWHQHGYRHANHEPSGKKQEFGPTRIEGDLIRDLDRGRSTLQKILGEHFSPIFTPPWNRCDGRTLAHLRRRGYRGISRFAGSMPASLPGLPDFFVNVDLHTRKESIPTHAWDHLLDDFSRAFESGRCGIMLHHQRMSEAAFTFLELLLKFVLNSNQIRLTHLVPSARTF